MTQKLTQQEKDARKAQRKDELERKRNNAETKAALDALPEMMEIKVLISRECFREWRTFLHLRGMMGEIYGLADAIQCRLIQALELQMPEVKIELVKKKGRAP